MNKIKTNNRQWLLMAAAAIFLGLIIVGTLPNLGVDLRVKAEKNGQRGIFPGGNFFDLLNSLGDKSLKVFLEKANEQLDQEIKRLNKKIKVTEKQLNKPPDQTTKIAAAKIKRFLIKLQKSLLAVRAANDKLIILLTERIAKIKLAEKEKMNGKILDQLYSTLKLAKQLRSQLRCLQAAAKGHYKGLLDKLTDSGFWLKAALVGALRRQVELEAERELGGVITKAKKKAASQKWGRLRVEGKYWRLGGLAAGGYLMQYTKRRKEQVILEEIKKRLAKELDASQIDLYIKTLQSTLGFYKKK